jgi:hypothetical protein
MLKNKQLYKNKEYVNISLIYSSILILIFFLLQNTNFLVYFDQLVEKRNQVHQLRKRRKKDTLKNHVKSIYYLTINYIDRVYLNGVFYFYSCDIGHIQYFII